jgi:DMSO/TMAO reductase YedYZ molybdopterin-dependent catalytic subunit
MNSPTYDGLAVVTESPLNAETKPASWLKKLTPNSEFYIRNHFPIPEINSENWSLKVSGQIDSELKFSLDEIKSWPKVTKRVLLECAGNGRKSLDPPIKGTNWGFGAIAQAEFSGTPLKQLIDRVQPHPSSVEALFVGADFGKVRTGDEIPYARSMPIEATLDEDIILCWEMNGSPLPEAHGFPLRLLVPGRYGMSSVKWLDEIQFIDTNFDGFFQVDDYVYIQAEGIKDGTPVGPMRVRSLIASHESGQTIQPGSHTIQGIAWSGEGQLTQVELSQDGGATWMQAVLNPDPNDYAWTPWSIEVEIADLGAIEIMSRAQDSAGNQQPLQQYWNKGGYGNNIVQRVSVEVAS